MQLFSRFIRNIEQIAEKYPLTPSSLSSITQTEKLAIYGTDETVGKFHGLSFFQLDDGYSFGPDQEQLNTDLKTNLGIHLPSDVLTTKNMPNARISLVVYSTNVMFRDKKLERQTGG